MTANIPCGSRKGCVTVPASKSWAHRMLITAALSETKSEIICDGISKDISATVKCLNGLGAGIETEENAGKDTVLKVSPVKRTVDRSGQSAIYAPLYCGESGSTLRFLIPIVGALGADAVFHMEGRLSERPLGPLIDVLSEHGMSFRKDGQLLYCSGQLMSGTFSIPGNISSQYISGLLMALPIIGKDSTLEVTGPVESADYIAMTLRAVEEAGAVIGREGNTYSIKGGQRYNIKDRLIVEKDWSSAAFPLSMGAFSKEGMTVTGLNLNSVQGDKEIVSILERFGAEVEVLRDSKQNTEKCSLKDYMNSVEKNGEAGLVDITVRAGKLKGQIIDASRIPDLVPVISVVAAGAEGETRIIKAERLRLKESDRLETTAAMLKSVGADAEVTDDGLLIRGCAGVGTGLKGGTVDAFNDHRIAMSAAVAAGICGGDVNVQGPECTDKSFPGFWDMMEKLAKEENDR